MSGVSYRQDGTVAVISMDDGKVNALGLGMLGEINGALDQAEADAVKAVVIAGNDRVFSGGFDLKVFRSGDAQASLDMLKAGLSLSHRLLSFRTPVIAACTGHAIAMGSFLACSTDHRIAAPAYNFQANEVVIGMVIPWAALEVLKLRLTRSAYQQATGLAKVFFGETALAAGFIDEMDQPQMVLPRAEEAAHEFATSLNLQAHHATKLRARQEALEAIQTGVDNMHLELGLG